jgi:hypothetical protein
VLVVVIIMRRVPVPVVHVVHVVTVWDRDMPASLAVHVVVPGMRVVPTLGALVEVTVVAYVQVPVVDVVDMVAVRDRDVSARLAMHVAVPGVLAMLG